MPAGTAVTMTVSPLLHDADGSGGHAGGGRDGTGDRPAARLGGAGLLGVDQRTANDTKGEREGDDDGTHGRDSFFGVIRNPLPEKLWAEDRVSLASCQDPCFVHVDVGVPTGGMATVDRLLGNGLVAPERHAEQAARVSQLTG